MKDRSMTKMAFNPISYYLTVEGWRPELAPPLPTILQVVKDTGYDGIHAEVPKGSTARDYLTLLGDFGIAPAPGWFSPADFTPAARAEVIESAKAVAAEHAELGLDRIFFAHNNEDYRMAIPAIGVDYDEERLKVIAEGMIRVAEAMVAEGVTPMLHAHVGSPVETVAETEFVLNRADRGIMMLGPDTGHLSWAGADLVPFLKRHVDRVGGVHIKDYRKPVADRITAERKSYRDAGAAGIWTEPGRGTIDLDGALAAIPDFDGWFVVEVDIADQPTVEDTARVAADWLRPRLEARAAR